MHPFDRYAGFTDLEQLLKYSSMPLRKSIRINTIKTDVPTFKKYADSQGWELQDVPWCREAFFIDRENKEQALGRNPRHLFGHFYMQEAASMLPVELLQPEPEEIILDMSAAPGSKTTQIAAKMKTRGVIIANDVQEKRLWTLKSALHRSGVTNNLVTKKVGQWFGKHMTERSDRVLCDAPCSAEGTVRKDSDALNYCSIENMEKMARVQFQLLEAAIHATKVGGRIVYSTCTLTPQENEGVILQMLDRYPDQLEVIDPRTLDIAPEGYWEASINDSIKMQKEALQSNTELPLLRLWPQTYDTEGFFCAVLQKKAPTRDVLPMDWMNFQERELSKKQRQEIGNKVEEHYGTSFMNEEDRLFQRGELLLLGTDSIAHFGLPVQNYSLGIPYGKVLKDGRIRLDHELVTLRGAIATKLRLDVDDEQFAELLAAKDVSCNPEVRGHCILFHDGIPFGLGLAKEGMLKNNLPRWMVRFD